MPTLSTHISNECARGGAFELIANPLEDLEDVFTLVQFRSEVSGHGLAHGLGVGPTVKKAQIVAYFEFLERKAFIENVSTHQLSSTNGIASHKFSILAKRAAISELFERDSFLAHWYSQKPFAEAPQTKFTLKVSRRLKSRGISLKLRQTRLGYAQTTVSLLVNDDTGGFCVGTSTGRGRNDANKATIEAIINYFYGNYGKSKSELMPQNRLEKLESLEDHRAYWLYCATIPSWMEHTDDLSLKPQSDRTPVITTRLLTRSPYPVFVAKSNGLLGISIGTPDMGSLMPLTNRLPLNYRLYTEFPHPLF